MGISDFLICLGAAAIALSFITFIWMRFHLLIEARMDMGRINSLMKLVILFSTVILPLLSWVILYRLTVIEKIFYVESDDFEYMTVIGNQSISLVANQGNHWSFVLLLAVWTAGFLWFGVRRFIKHTLLLKKLEACSSPCRNPCVLRLKEELTRELGIKKEAVILTSGIIYSPFTAGVIQKRIFLPDTEHTGEEWRLLLEHELVHCRSGDLICRKLVFLMRSVYWFVPFIYRLADYSVEVNEMACDKKVLEHQPVCVRARYASLILEAQETEGEPLGASLSGQTEESLERRIRHIMKTAGQGNPWTILALSALLVLMCPFAAFGSAYGVSGLQDWLVRNVLVKEVEETQNDEEMVIQREKLSTERIIKDAFAVDPQKGGWIELTIQGKVLLEGGSVFLTGESWVGFLVEGGRETDCFRIGLININGEKIYVESEDGWVHRTFRDLFGTHWIFIEGVTEQQVHIRGNVTVLH